MIRPGNPIPFRVTAAAAAAAAEPRSRFRHVPARPGPAAQLRLRVAGPDGPPGPTGLSQCPSCGSGRPSTPAFIPCQRALGGGSAARGREREKRPTRTARDRMGRDGRAGPGRAGSLLEEGLGRLRALGLELLARTRTHTHTHAQALTNTRTHSPLTEAGRRPGQGRPGRAHHPLSLTHTTIQPRNYIHTHIHHATPPLQRGA